MKLLLRECRKERGLTQTALSIASGVSRVNISKYESGLSDPTINTAMKLAKAMNVTMNDLIDDKED